MTKYRYDNCRVSQVQQWGRRGSDGYGFSILSRGGNPLVALVFATREDADKAQATVASVVEKAVEVVPQAYGPPPGSPAFQRQTAIS
jgi:hypothetical protein